MVIERNEINIFKTKKVIVVKQQKCLKIPFLKFAMKISLENKLTFSLYAGNFLSYMLFISKCESEKGLSVYKLRST